MKFTFGYNNPKKFTFGFINSKVFTFGYSNPKKFTFGQTYPIFWWAKWGLLMGYLWTGLNFIDWLISSFVDRRKITMTGRDFIGSIIPMATTTSFKLANDADFILDDTPDNLWFTGGVQNTISHADLYNYDYYRTVVKSTHQSPYSTSAIGVMKSGVVLTPAQNDQLHADFELWLFWSGAWNDNGFFKDNRIMP